MWKLCLSHLKVIFTVFAAARVCDGFKVGLFIQRLCSDWDRAVAKKAWVQKDAWVIHASCGGFLAIMDQLQRSIPQKDFAEAENDIKDQFHLGCLDHDIISFLEASVPPVSLEQVPFVRTAASQNCLKDRNSW